MMLFLPLVGCHAFTPGSTSLISSLNTADWIMRLLLRPAPISSMSIADLTFSRSCLTSLMLMSASKRAVHISFSIESSTSLLMMVALLSDRRALVILRPKSARTILPELWGL
uniref:Putative secreted protein n=1 Tax=Ixodes ricinus TaxID=34613 RepID=A0A6B0UJM2_IXORI